MNEGKLSEEELDAIDNTTLVERMDYILESPYWERRGNDIMKLKVGEIFHSTIVQKFAPTFQRKVIYKSFGLLLQLLYTNFAVSAQFFHIEKDFEPGKQIHYAARKQWQIVSSRIAFEYFIHLTYMLGTGKDFKTGASALKRYRKWLKEQDNPYTYFAITAARAKEYDRTMRTPEVHAGTKLARQILLSSATDIDNDIFHLCNTLKNQWQFILDIVNEREPKGWVSSVSDATGDKEWYNIWESGDYDAISDEIDRMFSG
ncbi:hypothetical protein ACFLYG_03905 [Chloroflexota bacterium]